MLDKHTVLTLFEEMAQHFAFNLGFIPDEKFAWKSAPEAKSALEIVNHWGHYLTALCARLDGQSAEFSPASDKASAQAVVQKCATRFLAAARNASPELLAQRYTDEMPFSNGWMITIATIDTIHHGGQIAYIQTLLGDSEDHFDAEKIPDWQVG